jgi:DNA-binding transcriptional LysR family regulator
MELRQLSYFVMVTEEQNFTRAAERARIAQPAISQQIQRLERQLGEPLFDRTQRGARLTPAGQALLPHARAALTAAQQGQQAIAALRGLITGRLTLGTVQHGPPGLAAALGQFRREHPGVDISVREAHTGPLLAALGEGELDLAFIGMGSSQRLPAGLQGETVATEPVVLAVHREHPLADRDSVPLSWLRDEPMVTLAEGSGQRVMLGDAARAAGFTPHIVAETSQLSLLTELAINAIGAAIVPQSATRPSPQLAIVRISRPKMEHRLILTWRETPLPPAAREFLATARACLIAPPSAIVTK